ncbi:uncharacterized protein [Diadema antillarum]|uniref:uncharacterized protein n=1 Tax=Diadema antillarum TaxID=105358 RepID=UPI003A85A8B6
MATVQLPPVQPTAQVITTITPSTDEARLRATQNSLRVQSILQLVGAGLLLLFGIIAIVIMARFSYYATPIWTAVVFFAPAGISGLVASKSRQRSAAITACIVFSSLGCACAFSLFIVYICAASWEPISRYYGTWYCLPSNYVFYCGYSPGGRKTIDAFLILTSIFLFVVDIFSLVCCATYVRMTEGDSGSCAACCALNCSCCIPPPPPTTAVITAGGPPAQQAGITTLQVGVPHQPQPVYYVVQQGPVQGQQIPGAMTTYPTQPPLGGQPKLAEPPVLYPSSQNTAPNVHTSQPNSSPPPYST